MVDDTFLTQLASRLRAPLLRDSVDVEPFARDFSRLFARMPRAVARASTESEVAEVFRLAAHHGVEVKLRGAGHSCNGQALSDGGLVLQTFEDGGKVALDLTTGLAEVPARSSWLEVQTQLVSEGRGCPVLTDYLLLSVGGTLSAGGYGARSISSGAQIDNVERLRVVLRNGVALWCSAREHREVFLHALAGQGAIAAIERAVIRTIPHKPFSRVYGYEHKGLVDLADSLAWLDGWDGPMPDLFVGSQRFGRETTSTVGQFGFDIDESRRLDPYFLTPLASKTPNWVEVHPNPELRAHARTVDLVESHADHLRLWSDYMFGYAGFVEFVRLIEQRLKEPRFREHLSVIGLLVHQSPSGKIDFPFEVSRDSLGRYKYMVGLYFFVPSTETAAVGYLRGVTDELLESCLKLGGRPYRYGYADLNASRRHALFGSAEEEIKKILLAYSAG